MQKNKKEDLNILFLYAGANRRSLSDAFLRGVAPDSSFFGLQHLKSLTTGCAGFFEPRGLYSPGIEKIVRKYGGFNVSFLPVLFKIWNYDVVLSPVAIPVLLIRSLVPVKKPLWFVFNLSLTNLLKRNKGNIIKYNVILFALRRAAHIICLSNSQKNFLKSVGLNEEKISVVLFGVDKNFYKPQNNVETSKNYILSVGRDNGRDYETLFSAARSIDTKFIVVCSPRNLVGISDIPDNVEVRYDVGYTDLRDLYQNAQFVVVSSQNEEYLDGSDCSGQTVILDAMSSGKAVVVTYRTWMDDYFTNEKDCLIVPPKSPEALKEKILFLLQNPEKIKIIGTEARKHVETSLNSEYMAEKLYAVFIKIRSKNSHELKPYL